MKWSLQQLFKYLGKAFTFSEVYDFHNEIEKIDDILDISEIKVEGTGKCQYDDRYKFDLKITGILYLEDAWTLEKIEYPIDVEVEEIYDISNKDNDDIRIIEKNTIDLHDAVWENILLLKPMRVTKKDE